VIRLIDQNPASALIKRQAGSPRPTHGSIP